ncbi:hypothetical protein HDV00_001334, partial [Rhizophlyctis rosea]
RMVEQEREKNLAREAEHRKYMEELTKGMTELRIDLAQSRNRTQAPLISGSTTAECYNCLQKGHYANRCPNPAKCRTCGGNHTTRDHASSIQILQVQKDDEIKRLKAEGEFSMRGPSRGTDNLYENPRPPEDRLILAADREKGKKSIRSKPYDKDKEKRELDKENGETSKTSESVVSGVLQPSGITELGEGDVMHKPTGVNVTVELDPAADLSRVRKVVYSDENIQSTSKTSASNVSPVPQGLQGSTPMEVEETREHKKKDKKKRNRSPSAYEDKMLAQLPKRIRIAIGERPFDIMKFLRTVKMDGLSLADLVWISPYVKKTLQDALRQVPKDQMILILAEYPTIHDELEKPEAYLYMFSQKFVLEMSKYSTHTIRGHVSGISTGGMIDGGACTNCISPEYVERAGLQITKRTTSDRFVGIGNQIPNVLGEVHGCSFSIDVITVPFSAVVIEGMQGDLLLGRPFLEKTAAKVDYDTG